jgi:predicted DNA-binding transcriptional regulator YafY
VYYQTVTRHEKALAILRLAREMQCRTAGISLDEISELFRVSRRTAERMRDAVLSIYPDGEVTWGADGVKRWHIPGTSSDSFDPLQTEELAALNSAVAVLRQNGLEEQARQVQSLTAKVQRLLPRKVRTRIEPDLELLMMSEGLAQRPGPRPRIDPSVLTDVREAILGCLQVRFTYSARISGEVTTRTVEPYGLLYGLRPYLLAWDRNAEPEGFRLFSLSEISGLSITDQGFVRQEDFSLKDYAERSFGAFQEPPVNVVWRVSPRAAADARTWLFHPTQTLEDQPDGSLIVRFRAGGLLEMCWHLFTWGGEIEVLEPAGLKDRMSVLLSAGGGVHRE